MSRELVKGNFFHNTSEKFAHNYNNKYLSKDQLQRPLKVGNFIYFGFERKNPNRLAPPRTRGPVDETALGPDHGPEAANMPELGFESSQSEDRGPVHEVQVPHFGRRPDRPDQGGPGGPLRPRPIQKEKGASGPGLAARTDHSVSSPEAHPKGPNGIQNPALHFQLEEPQGVHDPH